MPCLRIETNVPRASIDFDAMSSELAAAVAKTLGKPIGYCMVIVVPDALLTMGAGEDAKKPAANASLMSIGRLGLEENKKHAAALYPIITKHLGVDGQRCYLHFQDAPSKDIGFDGTTFHDILG